MTDQKRSPKKFLRWAGSKSGVAAQLEKHIAFEKLYIEPFAGSSVLFFRNTPSKALLNDINSHLINLYIDVKDDPDRIWTIYNSLDLDSSSYSKARSRFNATRRSKLKSSLFLFLNHNCFNGIYRTNSKGEFNTPYGGSRLSKKMSKDQLREISASLKSANFYSLDFEVFLNTTKPENACIYMDPPYFTEERRVFREYGPGVFSRSDLERLASICGRLAKCGNRIVVSYQDCHEFRDLFRDHIVDSVDVVRNVGGFRDRRKRHNELIAVL